MKLFQSYSVNHQLDHEIRGLRDMIGGDIDWDGVNAPLKILRAVGVTDGRNPLHVRRHVIERLAYEAGVVADLAEEGKPEEDRDLGAGARLRDSILESLRGSA